MECKDSDVLARILQIDSTHCFFVNTQDILYNTTAKVQVHQVAVALNCMVRFSSSFYWSGEREDFEELDSIHFNE